LFQETGIGNAEQGEDQHQAERQLSVSEAYVWPVVDAGLLITRSRIPEICIHAAHLG